MCAGFDSTYEGLKQVELRRALEMERQFRQYL